MPQDYGLNLFQRSHSANLIDNWSFETDITTGWADANWEVAALTDGFAKFGRYSAHFSDATFDGDEYFRTDLITGVVASAEYTASMWLKKTTCTGTGIMILQWYTIADAAISQVVLAFDTGTHDWKKYSITATAPATAAKAIVYAFEFTGVTVGTAFEAYIDGVILAATMSAGLAYTGDLTYHAQGWKRSSHAVGGYWAGSFTLSNDTLSKAELDDFYNNMLGCRLVETCYGMVSWEGLIWTMDYHQRGSTFRRTLDKSMFHNAVAIIFSNDEGGRVVTGISTNADSAAEYGTCTLYEPYGGANLAAAQARRDSLYYSHAWPRSREVGTLTIGKGNLPSDDYIAVTVAGYWQALNFEYHINTVEENTPNEILTTLLGENQFVTEGSLETNADVVRIDCYPTPMQVGDAIAKVIGFGDSAGDVWQGGVYADRKFHYGQASTSWSYQYRDGRLLDRAGQDVVFPLLNAGFLMFNASAPTGGQPPGTSTAWDDPRYRYVEEVEFVAPDEILLRFGQSDQPLIIRRRVESKLYSTGGLWYE